MELCRKGLDLHQKVASLKTQLCVTNRVQDSSGDGVERIYLKVNSDWLSLTSTYAIAMQGFTDHISNCGDCNV